jgi:isocitrate lyase
MQGHHTALTDPLVRHLALLSLARYVQPGRAACHQHHNLLLSSPPTPCPACQVLVPISEFVQKLTAARLAADVCDVPTIIIARTDALGAYLLTNDVDPRDKPFLTGAFCVALHM